jgi:class 3 adenylate cyclase
MLQERLVRVERRLLAILVADTAGYSRLMHRDEEAMHAKLATVLAESITPRLRNTAGES